MLDGLFYFVYLLYAVFNHTYRKTIFPHQRKAYQ